MPFVKQGLLPWLDLLSFSPSFPTKGEGRLGGVWWGVRGVEEGDGDGALELWRAGTAI